MYKVSEYSNDNQEREDASMKEESVAIEIDNGDVVQDNDYNMSADEDNAEKPIDSIDEEGKIYEIEDELLSSGDEEIGSEIREVEAETSGDNYRNVVEFNSEDEIENLEESEHIFEKPTENLNENESGDYLSNDSVVELDELNNFQDHEDVQEIPPPQNAMYKIDSKGYNAQQDLAKKQNEVSINRSDHNDMKERKANTSANLKIFEENEEDDVQENEKENEKEKMEQKEEKDKEELEEETEKEEKEEEVQEREKEKVEKEEVDNKRIVIKQLSDNETYKDQKSILVETPIEETIEYNEKDDGKNEKNEDLFNKEKAPATNMDSQYKSLDSKLEFTFPIIINIAETDFLLVPFNKLKNPDIDVSHLVSLYDDKDILKLTIEEFFGLMRTNEDLNEIHQFTVNKELVLVIPELNNLSITEDNIYSRDITIEDFIMSFDNLKSNSMNSGEELVHNSISFLLTSQMRFITNFNNLSESIREGKGFTSIKLEQPEQTGTAPELYVIDSNKRQSLDSSDEADTHQTKRVKVSI